jgi:hypothetical protein
MDTASNYPQVTAVNRKEEEMTRAELTATKKERRHKQVSIITTCNTSKDDRKECDERNDERNVTERNVTKNRINKG